jgi:hypothetical protein
LVVVGVAEDLGDEAEVVGLVLVEVEGVADLLVEEGVEQVVPAMVRHTTTNTTRPQHLQSMEMQRLVPSQT